MSSAAGSVLLATFAGLPGGEPGHEVLDRALASHGIRAVWTCWDDPDADWSAADLVSVRSTWDYTDRREEFLLWAARVEQGSVLLNGARAFGWNTDKAYLAQLAHRHLDLPVVPTVLVDGPADLAGARAELGDLVVKPRVGAGGEGVVVVRRDAPLEQAALRQPMVAQPLVESVRSAGELSVFVLDGQPVSMVRKVPGPGEIRVHEHLGGTYDAVPLEAEPARVAAAAMAAAQELTGSPLDYGRVDLLHWAGTWRVSELELVEPALYLDAVPGNGDAFARLVAARLEGLVPSDYSV